MLRRGFLTGALSLGTASAAGWVVASSRQQTKVGNLVADPKGVLDLPAGFAYAVLERSGDVMSDGHPVGELPDGMACFAGDGETLILMRNHELARGVSPVPAAAYNPAMAGGVTRLVLDRTTLKRKSSNWVLTGTNRNCAGGPSPWGWLTCEETTDSGHGYVFVCGINEQVAKAPHKLPSLGRFKHEAVAVDAKTQVIYLTEDQRESCLYRHVPQGSPFAGRLEAMRILGTKNKDLSKGLAVGVHFQVDWVPIGDPEGDPVTTYAQGAAQGAAIVNRGEGMWHFDGSVFFVSTAGGPKGGGQVFRLDPTASGGTLTLIAQAEDDDSFLNPDNITVSPAGEVFVVEDNGGPNRIHRLGPDGAVTPFGRNRLHGGSSELCGVCFSPDGAVMFVNMQGDGLTLAITGPFSRV